MRQNIYAVNNIEQTAIMNIDDFFVLYHLYEFTDDILFLTQTTLNYPNIFNFVKTGILTEEEAYEGLLYQNK